MNWWREFANQIERDAPVGRSTWFRLGGRARYLFRPLDVQQLAGLIQRARQEDIPVKVLGCGANVLVSDDGFDGVVVRLDGEPFQNVRETTDDQIEVGAGVDLMPLSRGLSERGLSGLEFMAGIPATMGGAVRMNAGGPTREISGVVADITVMDSDGAIDVWDHDRVGFGYRKTELGECIVLSARLQLTPDDPTRIKRTYDDCFAFKQKTQPLADRSAGCIFRNPLGGSAGALIDRAGLKGTRCGGASVSDRHANFIVADSTATASDVLRLIDRVREQVQEMFETELELELEVLRPRRYGGGQG